MVILKQLPAGGTIDGGRTGVRGWLGRAVNHASTAGIGPAAGARAPAGWRGGGSHKRTIACDFPTPAVLKSKYPKKTTKTRSKFNQNQIKIKSEYNQNWGGGPVGTTYPPPGGSPTLKRGQRGMDVNLREVWALGCHKGGTMKPLSLSESPRHSLETYG